MRKKYAQMSLFDTYSKVEEHLEKDKAELFRLLDEQLDWEQIIPSTFYTAFYQWLGRNRRYSLMKVL